MKKVLLFVTLSLFTQFCFSQNDFKPKIDPFTTSKIKDKIYSTIQNYSGTQPLCIYRRTVSKIANMPILTPVLRNYNMPIIKPQPEDISYIPNACQENKSLLQKKISNISLQKK